jgi:uncharacterized protein
MKIKKRLLNIDLPQNKSAFLWGPRKVGKTYWIKHNLKNIILIDLLKTDIFAEYISKPSLLRERYSDQKKLIVIDEIQMVPNLLNEIHWMIENKGTSFLLTGSSPRKLKRNHANLLGGRAWRYSMAPLCYLEIDNFDIEQIMITGLLPPHVISPDPIQDLRAYIADYLKEEIATEAVVQNIPAFSEFLKLAALSSGELINYTNIARETGVSAKIIRNYFQILEDTLLGFRIQPWRKSLSRRLIETEKFYLFDIGVTNFIAKRTPKIGTPEFGKVFEQFILMELKAYQSYRNPEMPIYYWRTSSGLEVDFICGEMDLAIEIKSSKRVHEADTKGLLALKQEQKVKKAIIISFEKERKIIHNLECLYWQDFLNKLWSNEFQL